MIIMKLLKSILIGLLAVVVLGCNKEWLQPKPLSIYTPENTYVNKEGMEAGLLVLRKYLRDDFVGKWPSNIAYELISSDLSVAGETRWGLIQDFNLHVTPTNFGELNNLDHWDDAWKSIREANVLISRIDAPEWGNENEKNAVLGEAFFHRAYWYYKLIHQYGEVPFLNREHTQPKTDFYTHSRAAILDKIRDDLIFSLEWLPDRVEPGKVNHAAAAHLLTKVYLAQSNFNAAIQTASSIIDGSGYSLMASRFGIVSGDNRFNLIWDLHQKENKSISENREAILVVQDKFGFAGASSDGTHSMFQFTPWWSHTLYVKDPDGNRGCIDAQNNWQVLAIGRGVGQTRPSRYFSYDIWEDSGADLRHDADTNWMPTSKIRYNNPASNYYGQPVDFSYSNPIDSIRGFFPWPHYKLYVEDQLRPAQPRGGNSDWYVFRLAETHLLRAEAFYWLGDLSSAVSDINAVRSRANAPTITPETVSLEYILDERARELSFEEPRKTELTRIAFIMAENGIDGYSIENMHTRNFWFDRVVAYNNFYNRGIQWEVNQFNVSPYHIFWPIPQNAIDANTGGRINQNRGYFGAENNQPPLTAVNEDQ